MATAVQHRLMIKHATLPPQIVIDLLLHTEIGTEGTLYQLLDTPVKIHRLQHPHFFYLERNEKALGNVTVCERKVWLESDQVQAFYVRYVAFQKKFQGGLKKGNANSSLHHFFKALFKSNNLNGHLPALEKSLFWAYIDPQNHRSFNLNSLFDFQTVGTFKTFAFSRVKPKAYQTERLQQEDKAAVLKAIEWFYEGFAFFSDAHLFENDNYFVRRVNGEIVCGIQANPVQWRIASLPGLGGKIMLKAAPFIPRINKLIRPKNHRFLATEGLFWKPGHEKEIAALLEGVLALTGYHSLLVWVDDKNDMLDGITLNWGLLQKIKKDNVVNIVAQFNGYKLDEIEAIAASPKYLSGFDVT